MSTARPAALLSTTNDDYLTENWQPRELEHSLVSFTRMGGGRRVSITIPVASRKTGGGMTARIVIIGGGCWRLGSENAA